MPETIEKRWASFLRWFWLWSLRALFMPSRMDEREFFSELSEVFTLEDMHPETAFDARDENMREKGRQEMRETTPEDRRYLETK